MIFSKKRNATYVGYTLNILKRLHLHNSNKGAKFTRGNFWVLVFSKSFISKNIAMKYEYKLKKNQVLRKKLLNSYLLKNK